MWTVQWALAVFCGLVFTPATGNISEPLSRATTNFSLELAKAVIRDQRGNVILSPVSVYALLAMLQQGASGRSREEVTSVLHALPDETKQGFQELTKQYQKSTELTTTQLASKLFLRKGYPIEQNFRRVLAEKFLSDIQAVNFSGSARELINSWAAESTHNRVTQLFAPGSPPADTVLALVNTVYFKTFFDHPFYSKTENKSFSPQAGVHVFVPTMYQEHYYRGGEDKRLGAKWVHVAFKDGADYALLLALPTERYGLQGLWDRLTPETLLSLMTHDGYRNVKLTLPKFKMGTDTKLIPQLRKLGLNSVFEDSADLSGISTQRIKVTEVVQKAEIAVDEYGVTASAATGLITQPMSAEYYPHAEELVFTADEPFMVMIVDKQNSLPLFVGRVSDPSS